jgi:hypothetical protein
MGQRGLKNCPSCQKACGPRTFFCACGHNFKPGETPKPKIEIKGIGRGKKQCTNCKSLVGPRTFVCTCGFEFKPGQKPKTEAVSTAPSPKVIKNKAAKQFVTDWWNITSGATVKVVGGSGDHYISESGDKVYMQDLGTYKVESKDDNGLIVNGASGHGYIYMGETKKSTVSGVITKEKHNLVVIG